MFAVRQAAHAATSASMRRHSVGVGAKRLNPLRASPALSAVRPSHKHKAALTTRANSGPPSADGEVDLFRDTPLRYMGYANEVGESFTAFLPVWGVPASYGVAGACCLLRCHLKINLHFDHLIL